MEALFISLLPYIIGSAIVPVQIIVGLLLLQSPHQGILKAGAYVSGMTLTRLLQGVIFGVVLAEPAVAAQEGSGKNGIVSTLLMVLGILLLITAYKKWRGADDPDAPPPKWLILIEQATPAKALGIGIGFPLIAAKLWVFTLSALATIAAAQLGQPASAIAFLLFVILAEVFLWLPIGMRVLRPKSSQPLLQRMADGLTACNRELIVVISLVFGLWFLASGLSGLAP
ncbi:GAP family protein [Trichothermofontia sp.]